MNQTRFKAAIPPLPESRMAMSQEVSRPTGPKQLYELIIPKHPDKWRHHFLLPHKEQYLNSQKVEYLDKGPYAVGDENLKDIRFDLQQKPGFRLYFKPLGAQDKDKVIGDLLPDTRKPTSPFIAN